MPSNRGHLSYEEVAQIYTAARLNLKGDSAFHSGDYPAALAFYQQSMDSAAVQADSFLYYDSKLDIACVYYRIGEPEKSIEIAEPIVGAFIRSGDSTRIGQAYSTLAGFYDKANLPEKGLAAALEGFHILKQQGSLLHRCAAYNQMAFTHSRQNRWAEALPLLDTALQLMEASGDLEQRPSIRLNLGDCHRQLRHWAEARRYLGAAESEASGSGQVHVRAKAIELLSELSEATGDPLSALRFFRQAKQIRDSIFAEEKTRSLQELEVKYQTSEKEQQISLLKLEKKIEAGRKAIFVGIFLFALLILAYAVYANRAKLAHTRQELARNRQELLDHTQLLLTKNAHLKALEQALQELRQDTAADTEKHPGSIHPESLYNNRILTDNDWETFKRHFENSYPGYLLRLRTAYPELSGAEERLLLLIKLNLNTNEVADTLGITINGVKKGRQRLRKRLEMNPEEDLEQFVKNLLAQKTSL